MDYYKFIPSETALETIEKNNFTFLGQLDFNRANVFADYNSNDYFILPKDSYCPSLFISNERFLIECILKKEFPYSNSDHQDHNNKMLNYKNTFLEYRSKFEKINDSFSWIFNEPTREVLDGSAGNKINLDTNHLNTIEFWIRENKSLSQEEIKFLLCAVHNKVYSTMFSIFKVLGDLNPEYYLGLISNDLSKYHRIDDDVENFRTNKQTLIQAIKTLNQSTNANFLHRVDFFGVIHKTNPFGSNGF
jgi:hypothetical protein